MDIDMPYGAQSDDFCMEISVKVIDIYGAYTVLNLGRHRVRKVVNVCVRACVRGRARARACIKSIRA